MGSDWPSALATAQDIIRDFDRFSLPRLYASLNHLRQCAIQDDSRRTTAQSKNASTGGPRSNSQELLMADRKQPRLEEAARTIMRAFNFCLNDRAAMESSRKWGTYYVLCLLFKCYIKLGTLNLAKNSMRAINAAELPPLEAFPKSQAVSYKYFTGLYHFWNEQYPQAQEELSFAFQHCQRSNKKNKRLILRYLLPICLLHGRLPLPALLRRHGYREEYGSIVKAIKLGRLDLFDEAMAANEHLLLLQGTYLVVERLRLLVLRALFKRTYLVLDKSSRISVEQFQTALRLAGAAEVDADEVECLLANLIEKGMMKGYISHEKRMVVLSKGNAFPPTHAT